jgi:acid stress-induced BolA-like protein IbaG/YrbA
MERNQELGEKVKAILKAEFDPAEVNVSTRDAVVVFLYSERFEGMDDMDRQEAIWSLLERTLDREEQRAVAIVVALTPKERAFHTAGSA